MSEIKITINGVECVGRSGQTILEIANENGIFIPTLCQDPSVANYGACGVCLVEGEGLPKLMRSCSTAAADGWKVSSETPRVKQARKVALELLMSDHDGDCKGPCSLNCPAGTDCQGYVKAIANGDYHEAVRIVKETFPLPASIGHVCPHPCEDNCRRQFVEEPISIAYLKRFAGLKDLEKDTYRPEVAPSIGKKVAVVGGGPAGLTVAFLLKRKGVDVTIFDAMPNMGGMIRYGIPEYRLPKAIVDREVSEIAALGVTMCNNVKVGDDITLDDLRKDYDAVILAIGAWKSSKLGCKGDDMEGIVGGIDFLRVNILGEPMDVKGKNVAIVGGGNTSMDACRTSVRLGAENVYVIYRRTRNEMPAADEEIDEAIEEGVQFKFLTNPEEVIGKDGKVSQIKLQVMELGEPDASGRRSPVPVEGKFEILDVDMVIAAIGQQVNAEGFDVELNKKGTIVIDKSTFTTSVDGVFAIGDGANKAGIAIEAIGDGNKAADVIFSYLNGELVPYKAPFVSKRDLDNVKEELAAKEKSPRVAVPKREAAERRNDFKDIVIELSEDEVMAEAARCLECGCHDYKDCKLIKCANCDAICPERLKGDYHPGFVETRLVAIERNQRKCISCNLCVRTCDENAGKGILGLVGRGYTTVIKPEFNDPATIAGCADCHLCADICPTGALRIIK